MLERVAGIQQPSEMILDVSKPDSHLVADVDDVTAGESAHGAVLSKEPPRQLQGVSAGTKDVTNEAATCLVEHAFFQGVNAIGLMLQHRGKPLEGGTDKSMKHRKRPFAEMLAAVTHTLHQIRDRLRFFPVHADDEMRPDEEAEIGIRSRDCGKQITVVGINLRRLPRGARFFDGEMMKCEGIAQDQRLG